jgi:hypothetical protein
VTEFDFDKDVVFSPLDTQVPHAFQHQLSFESTPTLCDAIPAFELMTRVWTQLQDERPQARQIIQQGLDKLEAYRFRIGAVAAYDLAMCEYGILLACIVV